MERGAAKPSLTGTDNREQIQNWHLRAGNLEPDARRTGIAPGREVDKGGSCTIAINRQNPTGTTSFVNLVPTLALMLL